VSVAVNCQVCADVLVPSDSTLRLNIVPPDEALKMPHSCHAQLASVVANVLRNVITLDEPDGYVASIALRILFVAACRSVCDAEKAVVESPTPI
jgi:hypothetical protein